MVESNHERPGYGHFVFSTCNTCAHADNRLMKKIWNCIFETGTKAAFTVILFCLLAFVSQPVASANNSGQTLGFVVTTWNFALNETRFADECPRGMNPGYDEIWWRGLSKEDRAKYTDNGLKTRLDRYQFAIRRGKNSEDVSMNPTSAAAPPLLLAQGPASYGMNLDGTDDGRATSKTCKHDKYVGLDGAPAVDNQLYRLLGCVYGYQSYGQYQVNANENRKSNGLGMTLIEITGVDDLKNDNDVTVAFYRSIDQYTLNGAGGFMAFSSYRTDMADGKPRYNSRVKGKIVDGVVTTESGDVNLPFYGNYTYMNQLIRDMHMQLELSDDGVSARGMVAGYYGVDQLTFYACGVGPIASSGFSDCPAIYKAAHEIADGHPDPDTGKCTTLSSAFNFSAMSAFIVHPESEAVATAPANPVARFLSALGISGN
jgi:hypothetical protein